MAEPRKIKRALLSVYDKTGIVDFARALHEEFGIELISTGGTAKVLKDAGLPVTLVEEITGFPEMMDGRVKTLHPRIHAAILADRDNPDHMRKLAEQGIAPIDMVVVNLYPFEKTIAKPDCTFEEAIEMIDIGGPCLLRAAAKNHKHVLVVADPVEYEAVLGWLSNWMTDPECRAGEIRRGFGKTAFWTTALYDGKVTEWLDTRPADRADVAPDRILPLHMGRQLRYGENPHQQGVYQCLWEDGRHDVLGDSVAGSAVATSFNNYADASAALELCAELGRATGVGLSEEQQPKMGDRPPVGHLTGQRPVLQGPPAGEATTQNGGPTSGRSFEAGQPDSGGPTSGRSLSGQTAPQRSLRKAITDDHFTRRHLPHIERPEAVYFVTFRVKAGELAPAERDLVLSACRFWHGKKMTLHCATVMPDHVHLLLTPYEPSSEQWVPLGEIIKSIKTYAAREINMRRGTRGGIWLDETFDRIIRNEKDFGEKWEYMQFNPVTAGLVSEPREYDWFWQSGLGFGEFADASEKDRPEVGPPLSGCPLPSRSFIGSPSVACFIKHTNACGACVDTDPLEAYRKAYLGDPNAAMGGILAVDFEVKAEFAAAVMETYQRWGKDVGAGGFFVEVWLAPSFDDDAVQIIRTRKQWGERVRLLGVGDMHIAPGSKEMDIKRIAGGVLIQDRDLVGLNEDQWKIVTERHPTAEELDNLRLAWLICKHTKSNAITVCNDGMLIGNGAGQMSRVMSCRIATWLARENGHENRLSGAAAASDAFFPFRDGPDILADAGVRALIQPGGSKRDQEVIDACNERGVAMIFTGTRHFRH